MFLTNHSKCKLHLDRFVKPSDLVIPSEIAPLVVFIRLAIVGQIAPLVVFISLATRQVKRCSLGLQ